MVGEPDEAITSHFAPASRSSDAWQKCRWGSLANRRQDYFQTFCRGPMDSAHMRPAESALTMLF
jgi:hypothetical protein